MTSSSYYNSVFDFLVNPLRRAVHWAKSKRPIDTKSEAALTPVVFASFATRTEAEYAKSILESEGILSLVQADDAGGMESPIARSSYLAVRESDIDRAMELLSVNQSPVDPDELEEAALSGQPPAE